MPAPTPLMVALKFLWNLMLGEGILKFYAAMEKANENHVHDPNYDDGYGDPGTNPPSPWQDQNGDGESDDIQNPADLGGGPHPLGPVDPPAPSIPFPQCTPEDGNGNGVPDDEEDPLSPVNRGGYDPREPFGGLGESVGGDSGWLVRDPFVLDLDGDGIETISVASGNPVLFDLDASGIKKSVGWIASDDGFLALDRNGNGTIDDGSELFGDATVLANGQTAADGFAALADLDTNGDGLFDSLDAQFTDVRVWRDLNQDGISQMGELFTLDEIGIASINAAPDATGATASNGNTITSTGSFTYTDSSAGTTGASGDANLAFDTFYSQFTDTLEISEDVALLPNVNGSGRVRTLHEAATQSDELTGLLTQFVEATTREEQMALMDAILGAWSNTSEMATTIYRRVCRVHAHGRHARLRPRIHSPGRPQLCCLPSLGEQTHDRRTLHGAHHDDRPARQRRRRQHRPLAELPQPAATSIRQNQGHRLPEPRHTNPPDPAD